jgi:hypothetical protein
LLSSSQNLFYFLYNRTQFSEEFISPLINLIEIAPQTITFKCLEVLSKVTISVSSIIDKEIKRSENDEIDDNPMTEASAAYALGMLRPDQLALLSRDRKVFQAILRLHAQHHHLLPGLHRILCHMSTLQPPEFIFISFGMELDLFFRKQLSSQMGISDNNKGLRSSVTKLARDLGKINCSGINLSLTYYLTILILLSLFSY